MEPTRSEEPREEIVEALAQAAALMVRHVSARQGAGLGTVLMLSRIDREGPLRLTVLAAAEGVSQPAMTQLVQRLARQGLVTRVSDPADARAALVGITDAGRALLADRQRTRHDRLAALVTTLSAEEETALALAMRVALPIIQRLIRNAAQADNSGGAPPDHITAEPATTGTPQDE
jgi:DNA-binding MarR family transcriptional regulator